MERNFKTSQFNKNLEKNPNPNQTKKYTVPRYTHGWGFFPQIISFQEYLHKYYTIEKNSPYLIVIIFLLCRYNWWVWFLFVLFLLERLSWRVNHFIAIQLQKQIDSFCKLSTDQFCTQHCAVVEDPLYVLVTAEAKSQALYRKFSSVFLFTGMLA